MHSKARKRGFAFIDVIIFLGIGLFVLFVASLILGREMGKTSKTGTCSIFSYGETAQGYCAATEADCTGMVNPIGKGCTKSYPVCCIGIPPKTDAGGGAGGAAATVELWVKNGDAYEKTDLPDTKAGNTDFKFNTNTKKIFQIRGTGPVTWCKISVDKQNKAEACSKDTGPSLDFTFGEAKEYDLLLVGYDKSGGKQLASAVADITVAESQP